MQGDSTVNLKAASIDAEKAYENNSIESLPIINRSNGNSTSLISKNDSYLKDYKTKFVQERLNTMTTYSDRE
jgi:hypothetical protein